MAEVTARRIERMIYVIRGEKVMLDSDLACLYEVETKYLNRQVKRNITRFPSEFMFQLKREEVIALKKNIPEFAASMRERKYLPYVFTEHGVAMLSGILNSELAIQVNISIIKTFVNLRKFLASEETLVDKIGQLEKGTNKLFRIVFERLDDVEKSIEELKGTVPLLPPSRRKIGLTKKKGD